MSGPATFQRIYANDTGPEHAATPEVVRTVLASMNEHASGPDPFRVRFRYADGTSVVASPKRRR